LIIKTVITLQRRCHIVERQLQYDKIKTVSLDSNIRVVKNVQRALANNKILIKPQIN
jgi:hypothetical protein